MGVLDKLLSAVKLNDDFDEDDLFDDDLMDDMDDDFFDEKEEKSRTGFFKFGRKKAEDDFDDYEDEIVEPKKPEKKRKEEPEFTYKSSAPKTFTVKTEKPEKTEKTEKVSKTSPSKITPMRSSRRGSQPATMEVCVLQPKSMEETHEIADTLLDNSTVILNLEGIDVELAQRISDFSFGVCYSLGGRLQKVSTYIFVLVPYNVDITGDLKNVLSGAAPSLRAGY